MSPKFKDTKMETDENNEKDPNDSKVIDFRKLFNDYKEQTEAGISYTNTHIEDVIFVDQFHVVALEYIYYQIEFEEQKEGEEDQEREQVPIYFGLENEEPESIVDDPKARDTTFSRKSYKPDDKSIFMDPPVKKIGKHGYLDTFNHHDSLKRKKTVALNENRRQSTLNMTMKSASLKNKKTSCTFMETEGGEALVEAYIGFYVINDKGQIKKEKQKQIHYDIRYRPSKHNVMQLKMSQDKQFIFLPYQVLDNQQSLTPSNES